MNTENINLNILFYFIKLLQKAKSKVKNLYKIVFRLL